MHERREAEREVSLGAPHEALLGQSCVGLVRDVGRAADEVELVLGLDRSQALDLAAARDEVDSGVPQHLPVRVRQVSALEPEPPVDVRRDATDQRALDLDELDPFDPSAGLGVPEVGKEHCAFAVDEERGVRATEPGQVEDVHRHRDEQWLLDLPAQVVDSVHVVSIRYARASRYPSAPFPSTRFAARSATTEWRRHSSRSSGLERCTSTIGTASSSSASLIA